MEMSPDPKNLQSVHLIVLALVKNLIEISKKLWTSFLGLILSRLEKTIAVKLQRGKVSFGSRMRIPKDYVKTFNLNY